MPDIVKIAKLTFVVHKTRASLLEKCRYWHEI